MRSNIFSYLPEEDREFIEDWVRVQVEKNTQSYSRFDRFLTFVERGATGVKNAVSGTANWVVETISKIGFHILVANVIETMNENETLTEQIAEIRKSSKNTFSKLVAEKGAALKLLEEKQAELDSANKRVQPKTVQRATTTSNTASSYNRNKFYGCIVGQASTSSGEVYYDNRVDGVETCLKAASCNDEAGYKLCWIGLRTGKWGSLDEAMRCWDRACQ